MQIIKYIAGTWDNNIPGLDFACCLAKQTNSCLEVIATPGGSKERVHEKQLSEIDYIGQACARRSVESKTEMIRISGEEMDGFDTRFTDLVILPADAGITKTTGISPSFVSRLIRHAECPVIIAPPSFEKIEALIVAFDGSASSVFAIKQFTYLFPFHQQTKIFIVHASENKGWDDTGKYKINEWLKAHYTNIEFVLLNGQTEESLFDYLLSYKNAFLITGAFGRNLLSKLIKPGTFQLLKEVISNPLFICHQP